MNLPRTYDYQDIEVRFGDLRAAAPGVSAAPGLLYEQQYMGGYTPRQANHLARDVEIVAGEWWRQNAPMAVRLDISLGRDVEFVASGPGSSRVVSLPLQEVEADVRRSVDRALSQLWRAVRDVQTDPEPPPRKTFWDHILEEE